MPTRSQVPLYIRLLTGRASEPGRARRSCPEGGRAAMRGYSRDGLGALVQMSPCRFDRSFQTDTRARPARPEGGVAESAPRRGGGMGPYWFDRSFQTDTRARPARPEGGVAESAPRSGGGMGPYWFDRSFQTDTRARPARPEDGAAESAP